jgi:diguanylate cyclase (GGDEF)-like protein
MAHPAQSLADESLPAQILQRGYAWLRFPDALEKHYRDDHRAGSRRMVRMSLVVAMITTAGFALIDHKVIHAVNATPDLVRFGLQFPVLLIAMLATSRRFYFRWHETAILIGAPLFGLGSVVMATNAMPEHMPLVGARLLLVAFFCYFMLGLRMRQALACNVFIFVCLVASGIAGLMPGAIVSYLAFALLCANIIGGAGAYALEHAGRTAFLERLSLEEMAARDGLTRLLNRQTFEFRANSLWRNGGPLNHSIAVLMIDVDYFKRYNDHYGHQAGDECLRRVAGAVRGAIDPTRDELVARYGGEELIALLIDRDAATVESIAREIVANITRQAIPHEASIVHEHVSVSVGATLPTNDASIPFKTLASIADKALYTAKHQGRNRCVVMHARHDEADPHADSEGVTRPEARALLQRDRNTLSGTATI